MAVAQKGRRRIIVNGRLFLWYVTDTEVGLMRRQADGLSVLLFMHLHVLSEDKRFNVKYLTGQSIVDAPYVPHVVVIGPEFPGLPGAGGRHQRVAVPRWDDDGISSRFVRRLVEWCLNPDKPIRLVNADGAYL